MNITLIAQNWNYLRAVLFAFLFLISLLLNPVHYTYARAASFDFFVISSFCSLFFWMSLMLMPAMARCTLNDFLLLFLLFSAVYFVSFTHYSDLPRSSCCCVSRRQSIEYGQVSSSARSESTPCGWCSARANHSHSAPTNYLGILADVHTTVSGVNLVLGERASHSPTIT